MLHNLAGEPNAMKTLIVDHEPRVRDLWVTEYVLTHDSQLIYTVSIMEFCGMKVCARDPILCRALSSRRSA
jgi:hypothetical protein